MQLFAALVYSTTDEWCRPTVDGTTVIVELKINVEVVVAPLFITGSLLASAPEVQSSAAETTVAVGPVVLDVVDDFNCRFIPSSITPTVNSTNCVVSLFQYLCVVLL